jgi:hypothetical protein
MKNIRKNKNNGFLVKKTIPGFTLSNRKMITLYLYVFYAKNMIISVILYTTASVKSLYSEVKKILLFVIRH